MALCRVSEALIFGAWMMGQALAFAPNFSAAVSAAGRVLALLERKSLITSTTTPAVLEEYVSTANKNFLILSLHSFVHVSFSCKKKEHSERDISDHFPPVFLLLQDGPAKGDQSILF